MTAVDTNVFIYALDSDEPVKQAKAVTLLERLSQNPEDAVIPWQVAVEYLARLRRWVDLGVFTAAEIEDTFERFRTAYVLKLPSESLFGVSFELRKRFSLSHWDSMLLAACKDAGVTNLYSEDLTDGMNYDGVLVVNPFK